MTVFIFLSAALLYLAYPNIFFLKGFWPLGWIFAVPLLRAIEGRPWWLRLTAGALFGVVFYGFLVQWFIPYTRIGYVIFVLALAVQPVVFCVLFSGRRDNGVTGCVEAALCWLISEWVRTQVMSGFAWGLAASQTFHLPALQNVSVIGGPGLGAVMIFFAACVRQIFCHPRAARMRWAAIAALVLPHLIGFGILGGAGQPAGAGLTVAAIQPNIPPEEKVEMSQVYEVLARQDAQARELAGGGADLVIWPETAVPTHFPSMPELLTTLQDTTRFLGSPMLVGGALRVEQGVYNRAVLLDLQGETREVYRKRILVPFSEYLPQELWWKWVARRLHIHNFDFIAGADAPLVHVPSMAGSGFGVLICNEDTIGRLFREYVKAGAAFIVVMLNDGWFRQPSALMMHGQNALLHAVEYGLPAVRAANTGWSCLIDARGRVSGALDDMQKRRNFLFDLHPATGKTVYYYLEPFLAGLAALGLLLIHGFRRKRGEKTLD